MSHAVTRCPSCGTSFRISEEQLLAAEGSVRCGACMGIFQAEDYFVSPMLDVTELLAIEADYWQDFDRYVIQLHERAEEEPVDSEVDPEPETEPEPQPEPLPGPVQLMAGGLVNFTEPLESSEETVKAEGLQFWEPQPIEEPVAEVSWWEPAEKQPVADFYKAPEREGPQEKEELSESVFIDESMLDDVPTFDIRVEDEPTIEFEDNRLLFPVAALKWIGGIAFMLPVSFGLYAWSAMAHYAQDERYRDYYQLACRYLFCEVPEYRNPDKLEAHELVIRSHPEAEAALVADFLLRNSGPYRQVFPGLRLRFFDRAGEIVAQRTFRVKEYLGGEMRGLKYIPAGAEVRLSIEIVDPGARALGYQLDVVAEPAR